MRIKARAKINWSLDITGQRADGYHLMDMLMQPVTLSDIVTLTPASEVTLTVSGNPTIPAGADNLAFRAAMALQKATGCQAGAAIHVEKRIPAGAGMGGGSADAAAVLAGLNRLWGLSLTQENLERLGLTLGADVPFCLRGGLTRTQGIGEKMTALPFAHCYEFVIVQPCKGLSTGAVFRAYHAQPNAVKPDTDAAIRALATGETALLASSLANVLQPVSEAERPAIRQAVEALHDLGALPALMTGSGSAVFGAFEQREKADAAAATLQKRWHHVWRCETCAESLIFEGRDDVGGTEPAASCGRYRQA